MRRAVQELVITAASLMQLAARLASECAADRADLLELVEAAKIARCSVRALRDARRRGELVMYGRQRSRTVRRADLDTWIESRKAPVSAGADDADMDRRMSLARAAKRSLRVA